MKEKLFANFFYQATYQVLIVLLPIISVPIVSKALGPPGIGTYNYVTSIVNYFVLVAGLGLANYAVREISFVRDNKEDLSKKFWEIQIFNLIFSVVVFLFYLIFSLYSRRSIIFLAQAPIVFSTILDITWFFQGIEDFKKITMTNAIIKIATFILIVGYIKQPSNLLRYVFIQSISTLASSAIFWIHIRNKVFFVRVTKKEIWGHFKPALNFFILKISATLFTNFNKTLLGIHSTMSVVGLFSNSLTLIIMGSSLLNTLNTVLLPRMSALQKNKDEKKMIQLLQKTIHFQFFLTIPLMFGIIALTPKMITWFFGAAFSDMKMLVVILTPIVVFQSLHQGIANQFLVPRDEMRAYNISMIFGAAINIFLGLVLIPKIHEYGAAISFLTGQLVLAISRSIVLIRTSMFRFDYRKIGTYLSSGLLMLWVITICSSSLPGNIITTTFQSILGLIFYMGITAIFGTNPIVNIIKDKRGILR
jgi:Membrane protein involved in the export of O-antigen and teichoic acid